MTESAILYDSSKCSACKGCQVQCKQWNMLPSSMVKDKYEYTGSYQSMSDLNGDTRLLIEFREQDTEQGIEWAFSRRACFHCTAACPFSVPKYRPNFGVSNKCTLCDDRVAKGLTLACVKTCPAGAMSYGPRDEMLAAGKARVEEIKTAGFSKAELYGETEMGGMHSLFVAKYGYEAHGLIRNPKKSDIASLFELAKPLAGIGVAAVLGGLGLSFLTGIGYKRDEPTVESVSAHDAAKEEE